MACCTTCYKPVEQDMREEHNMDSINGSTSKDDQGETSKDRNFEDSLMKTIGEGKFEDIEKLVTPRAFQKCESNSLLISMKVSYELRKLADTKGPDSVRFTRLANSVQEFTYCLLDPLKTYPGWREQFGEYALDDIINDAIEFEQKKFFTHPAVHSEMNRKWKGREFMKSKWKSWQLILFNIWCLFDLVFSPILLAVFSPLRNKGQDMREEHDMDSTDESISNEGNQTVAQLYLYYLESPYYKFVRDTLSYIILLFLHFALCLSPSTIAFSGLEWSILVFFIGRFLVELKQIWGIKQWLKRSREIENDGVLSRCFKTVSLYISDCWNKLDLVSLVVYLIILMLRIVTWIIAGSVTNNRELVIASYLYSFNTLCLTLRAFGHVMEQSKEVGTIQIALFSILKDVRAVFWQFMAAIVAFSFAISKIYISEKSFIANGSDRHEIACEKSGFSCLWVMFSHLGWSLLGESEESDPMASVDLPSVTLARLFYAVFLIVGVILLVNMLIALLSNTYQKTEDNSIKEWSFKRAMTIQTYDGYDPIPVPLNIIYTIFITLLRLCKSKDATKSSDLKDDIKKLEEKYFAEHANMFPVTDEMKVDLVFRETERNRQMMSHILSTTFASKGGDRGTPYPGQKAWHFHPGIRIEGPLLTFECKGSCKRPEEHWHGARYLKPLSPDFPHFEVTVIESGKTWLLGIGIVTEEYNISKMPGWKKESVGYHTDDGNIFHNDDDPDCAIKTEGPAMARRGDRIRCTVMFEKRQVRDGGKDQVPVFFTLNGKKIIIRREESTAESKDIFIDCDALFPFICMTEGSSVLAKMCAKEDGDLADFAPSERGALKENSAQLEEIKADLVDVGKHLICAREDVVRQSLHIQDVKSDLEAVREDVLNQSLQFQENLEDIKKTTRCLEKKLDALLAKLGEKE